MKSLVLLAYLSVAPGAPATPGKAEFFDDRAACQARMQEIRRENPVPGTARCICHKTVEEVSVEGNDAI